MKETDKHHSNNKILRIMIDIFLQLNYNIKQPRKQMNNQDLIKHINTTVTAFYTTNETHPVNL